MIEQLEQRLRAGETVIYRAPRRLEPNSWGRELLFYGACLALLWAVGIASFETPGLWALIGALAPILAHTLWVYSRDWSTAALVTNRRLLHRQGWLKTKITGILAAQVRAVDAESDRVRIELDDGACVFVGHPHDAWGLGVALAHSAGLALPRLASRREIVAQWGYSFCFLLITLAVSVAALEWLLAHWGWLAFALLLAPVDLLGAIAGLVLGSFFALILGRPILTFDEAVRCIANYDRLWLAERLYGRTA